MDKYLDTIQNGIYVIFVILFSILGFCAITKCIIQVVNYDSTENYVNKEELQAKLDKESDAFYKCLKNLPNGPRVTTFNDWNEVVKTCRNVSRDFVQ